MRIPVVLIAAAALAGCATQAPPKAAACTDFAHADALSDGLSKLYGDPKGVHLLVVSRTPDGRGGLIVDSQVWPLSGPQEPAPPRMARVVLDACTMQLRSATKLPR